MEDIFGKALYSYWKGDHTTNAIVRRDDNYFDDGGVDVYFEKELYPNESKVEQHVKGKILDVGCGAGRHVLYFQNKGFEISGIDTSHFGIQVCIERGCKNITELDVYKSGFAENTFDTILLFGQNIGIGGTIAGVKQLLTLLRTFLKENGTLVLTSLDVTKTDNEIHKAYQRKNIAEGKYIGELKLRTEYKEKIGNWFNWIHIEPKVLGKLALEIGWKSVEIHSEGNGEYSAAIKK